MYKINEISKIANISTRTLRYYDEIGLLKPAYTNSSNYRIYTVNEITTLQQILFYKQLGYNLTEIGKLINNPKFNLLESLHSHKISLDKQKKQIETLIKTVTKTIASVKGELKMNDKEKFEGFKEEIIQENEKKNGSEIRKKYGNEKIDASYDKMRKLSKWEFNRAQELSVEINKMLKRAVETNNPASEVSQKVCKLHQEWIQMYWSEYSEETHMGLVQMYTKDERFKAYYEKIADGATEFLYQSMKIYLNI